VIKVVTLRAAPPQIHPLRPRVGFAYTPGGLSRFTVGQGKTSIRGGFGIYYNRSEEELSLQDLQVPPLGFE